MKYLRFRAFLLLMVFSACFVQLKAQVTTATLNGEITDSQGAALPGASIVLLNEATGVKRIGTAGADGTYAFSFVPVGSYSLAISKTGFGVAKRNGITLAAAESLAENVAMQAADQQTVNVSSDASNQLQTESVAQEITLSAKKVNELPVARQDWTNLLQLGTAVVKQGNANNTSPAGASLTMNGLPPAAFNLTVDGTNATSDPDMSSFGFYQSPNTINTINNDAIQEVSIVKGIAPATIGGTMSGNVNLITKSGTNRFHGGLYEINEISDLDARNGFLTTKPRLTFNEFGGSIGGPVLRDHLFFFGSYEGVRLSSYSVVNGTVPTPYLESVSPKVYAPIFSAFPTVAQPAGEGTATTTQYFGSGSRSQKDGNGVARIDYSPNDSNQLYVRYTRGRPVTNNPNVISINNRVTTGHSDAFNAGYTRIGHSWTSNSRFGYNRLRLSRADQGLPSDLEQVVFDFDSGGAETFDKSGAFYTGEEGVAFSLGKHTLQVGAIVQRQEAGRTDLNTATVRYASLSDFQNNLPSGVTITFDLNPFTLHAYQFGGYAQDAYHVTSNLVLNLGIRYDYFTIPKEASGRVFNRGIDPAMPQLGPGFGPYVPADSMYKGDFNNFQPRFGFDYSPKHGSSVIRGGFGLLVNPHTMFGGPIASVQSSATQPFRITLNSAQVRNAGLKYPVERGNYAQILADLQSKGVISSNFANSTIDQNFPNPYSLQWTFGIQQQLGHATVLEMDYVGNRGLKENLTLEANLPDRLTGVAPDATFSEFQYYKAGDQSNYNGLQASLNQRFSNGFVLGLSYAWAKTMSLVDGDLLQQNAPQDANDVQADYGPAPYDLRNNFSGHFVWDVQPLTMWARSHGKAASTALGNWTVSSIVTARSGLPVNLVDGNSAYPADRPDASGKPFYLANSRETLQYLNPGMFTAVPLSAASGAQIRGGTLGRDAAYAPGQLNTDLTVSKRFFLTEATNLQFRADAFDLFNHRDLGGLVTNTTQSSFGQLTTATNRVMQLGVRLTF